jgi:hypothetical protein
MDVLRENADFNVLMLFLPKKPFSEH